jgi:hypothetical protein
MFYFTVMASSQLSEGDFYHQIANWGLYMAEVVLRLATLAVAKITLGPPIQYYLREKWDWPSRSKVSLLIRVLFLKFLNLSFFVQVTRSLRNIRMMRKGHLITVLRTKLVGQQLVYAVTTVSARTRAPQLALKNQGTLGHQPPANG